MLNGEMSEWVSSCVPSGAVPSCGHYSLAGAAKSNAAFMGAPPRWRWAFLRFRERPALGHTHIMNQGRDVRSGAAATYTPPLAGKGWG